MGLGRVKTKSDLVAMPSGRQIIPGAVIPPRVFYTARVIRDRGSGLCSATTSASLRKLTSGPREKLVAMGQKPT